MTDQGPMQPDYRRRMEAAEHCPICTTGTGFCRDWLNDLVAERDAAEAREQALRDRVGELADEMDVQTAASISTDFHGNPFPALVGSDRVRALLSPPTADTEESDR